MLDSLNNDRPQLKPVSSAKKKVDPDEKIFLQHSTEMPKTNEIRKNSAERNFRGNLNIYSAALALYKNAATAEEKQTQLSRMKEALGKILQECGNDYNYMLTLTKCFAPAKSVVYRITNTQSKEECMVLLSMEEQGVMPVPMNGNYDRFCDITADYQSKEAFLSVVKGCVTVQQVYTDDGDYPMDGMDDMYFYPNKPFVMARMTDCEPAASIDSMQNPAK